MNQHKHTLVSIVLACIATLSQSVFADIHLPHLLSDGAVLQRDTQNKLEGWASNGENVTIKLDGKTLSQTTVEHGRWSVDMPAQPAGGPHTLEFIGNNHISLSDIYFGDVWIAGGQSNMEIPMRRVKEKYADELAEANYPQIREFRVPKTYDFRKPNSDFDGGEWLAASPETIGNFSAVAYFFAKEIHQQHNIPIGLINNSYGGSAAESWMSEEALQAYPEHLKTALSYRDNDYLQSLINGDKATSDRWYSNLNSSDLGMLEHVKWYDRNYSATDWKTIDLPSFWKDEGLGAINGAIWFRKELILPQSFGREPGVLELGRIVDADTAYINGNKVGETGYQYPPRRYSFNTGTLRAGKNVITVRVVSNSGDGGFIKDKPYMLRVGKTNIDLSGEWQYKVGTTMSPLPAPKFLQYNRPLGFYNAMLAPVLNTSLKGVIWYQGESNTGRPEEYRTLFPDLIRDWRKQFGQGDLPFIFVQLPNYQEAKSEPSESQLAETRAAQAGALSEANTAMAVAIDLGEWNDIHPETKQPVGHRLALAARNLVYGEKGLVHSGPIFRSLKVKGKKITLEFDHIGSGLTTRDDEALQGFAVAGADGKYHWASTKLKKKKVIIWSDKVSKPLSVRYAWADNPDTANLYNEEGLPAMPFEAIYAPE